MYQHFVPHCFLQPRCWLSSACCTPWGPTFVSHQREMNNNKKEKKEEEQQKVCRNWTKRGQEIKSFTLLWSFAWAYCWYIVEAQMSVLLLNLLDIDPSGRPPQSEIQRRVRAFCDLPVEGMLLMPDTSQIALSFKRCSCGNINSSQLKQCNL